MSRRKISLRKGALRFYIFALFILVYGAIVLLYPKERKFEYEFKMGAPWMHEDLIAEYDFPVLKSQKQISFETDSIRRNFKAYYYQDSSVQKQNTEKLNHEFHAAWKNYWEKHNIRSVVFEIPSLRTEPVVIRDSILLAYQNLLNKIQEKGILNLPDSVNKNNFSFLLLKDDMSYERNAKDFYHLDKLDEYFSSNINYHIKNRPEQDKLLQEFIAEFKPGSFLKENLVYDQKTNDEILEDQLNNLSLTSGLVQKGELIIQQGGIVDDRSYAVLMSLKEEYESSASVTSKGLLFGGISLIYLATALALFIFLKNFKPKILKTARRVTFVLLQVFMFTGLAMLIAHNTSLSIYIIPFVIAPMMIETFFDDRTALFVHIIIIMMVGFVAPNGFEFVFIQMMAGIVAVFSLKNIQQRKRMFVTAFYVLLTYAVLFFSMQMLYGAGIQHIVWTDFIWFVGNALLILFTIPLIWVSEKLFGFISDATLMELTDSNHPLLRQLAEKAPGTFQHSLQVSNLAETVGREIGGNPLLIRTGALYHDIGKAATPEYFVENQSGFNPHDKLDFDESAQKIISHVTRGVEMAKKAKLPESVIDFIRTHHGIGKTQYFYRSFINKYPDREVDEDKFTYPGPSPRNIENAILMMADSIEAASRTLKVYNKESISQLVGNIIDSQLKEGQFDHVDITLRKLSKAKAVFTEKLLSIYHSRIEYPELNKKEKPNKEEKQ